MCMHGYLNVNHDTANVSDEDSDWSSGDNLDLNGDFLTDGLYAIRQYDPTSQSYAVVANMDRGRWYPSVMIMADGNMLIAAGMQEVMAHCKRYAQDAHFDFAFFVHS